MYKLAVMAFVYNEEALLPYFLRHYEQCADKIIVYDNKSTDRTRAILESHPLVERRVYDCDSFDDGDVVNLTNQVAAAVQTDWMIVVDIDEFVWPAHDLRSIIARCDDAGITIPVLQGYTMIAPEFPEICDGWQMTDCVKTGVEDEIYSKSALYKASAVEINYTIGKHRCRPTGRIVYGNDLGLKLLHYRYFGPEWHQWRNTRNADRLSPRALTQGWGWHIRKENIDGKYSLSWYRSQQVEQVIP